MHCHLDQNHCPVSQLTSSAAGLHSGRDQRPPTERSRPQATQHKCRAPDVARPGRAGRTTTWQKRRYASGHSRWMPFVTTGHAEKAPPEKVSYSPSRGPAVGITRAICPSGNNNMAAFSRLRVCLSKKCTGLAAQCQHPRPSPCPYSHPS